MQNETSGNVKSGCPVIVNDGTHSWNPVNWFSSQSRTSDASTSSECPVLGGGSGVGDSLPASIEESLRHRQAPMPDQTVPLNTSRVVSNIPRGVGNTPAHQGDSPSKNWVYPSEQQFYNAMRSKGWEADASTMASVVRIHNAVNERTWKEVCRWEKELHGASDPQLIKFVGRPKDMSPKALLKSLFYKKPFDRHDWYVDRGDGTVTRYVIDFYNGQESSATGTVSMHLDVRPAIDSPVHVVDRTRMAVRELFPGIFPPAK